MIELYLTWMGQNTKEKKTCGKMGSQKDIIYFSDSFFEIGIHKLEKIIDRYKKIESIW